MTDGEAGRRAGERLRAHAPPVPPAADARILAAIRRQARASRGPGRRAPVRVRGFALAAAALVAVVAVALALRPSLSAQEAQAVPIVPLTADCGAGSSPRPDDGTRRLVVAGVWA